MFKEICMETWMIVGLVVAAAMPVVIIASFFRGAREDWRRAESHFSR